MIARQPRAFGYTQFLQIADETSSSELEGYVKSIEAFFHEHLEPLRITWAGVTAEPMGSTQSRLRSMPGWRGLLSESERGDHIVVASPEAMASTFDDFVQAVEVSASLGCHVHVAETGSDYGDASQLAGLQHVAAIGRQVVDFNARQSRRRRQVANARRRLKGGHVAGSPPMGFKVAGQRGKRRLVPDEEARVTMRYIVQCRNDGHGFGAIAAYLRKNRVMWAKRSSAGRTLEFWDAKRVEVAYHRMLEIEQAAREGRLFQPQQIRPSRRPQALGIG
ncbi:MAG TPA: hypothetical protein VG826_34865 [Pirellulales bacterium]|nr:hypothetical protein [Pirellulales bacterium]